ncbi:MAG: response regulator [Campylobacterota bacterium]|nr:response regulator [Campylobacterota bacterium]
MLEIRVIIVEDESLTVRFVKGVLEKMGCTVMGYYDNGEDAINAVKRDRPDLILMDINIKGPMDGIQTTREISDIAAIPIVFITAYNDTETLDEVFELVPHGFISKPFTDKELEVAVRLAYLHFLTQQEKSSASEESSMIKLGENVCYDLERSVVLKESQPVQLGSLHSRLLQVLAQQHDQTVGYTQLLYEIWPDEEMSESSLRTLVYGLRKVCPGLDIVTQSKKGYILHTIRES